ncbi:MAG: redox-regulated ATPase YchF [Oscillospiraceae bacterium]|nr:redox-regulated ATPase YchF [Oscillospiraceae bacterium]
MKIGLVGLNQTGKTTLFRLLTGKDESSTSGGGKGTANIGTGIVPDERVDFLTGLYKPKKITYAKIELTDVAGFAVSENSGNSNAARFLNDVRGCDALVHVLRAFESDSVVHGFDTLDPMRDFEAVKTELLFADLEMIEKRIGRIKTGKKVTKENEKEIALLERCFAWLENGGTILDMEMTEEERLEIRGFAFLTEKPALIVVNVDESQWESKQWKNATELKSLCTEQSIPLIELCVGVELEISELPEDDRVTFMEDMGIEIPGVAALAMAVYELLGLISFLTVGEDEVRAWTIESGTVARKAAGKIHTDIERGFIRAEVVKYADIHELGAMAKVKENGLFKLEGKEYVVADGDIINFRFNV